MDRPTLARGRMVVTRPLLVVLTVAIAQAGGIAEAQLNKALREAAAREAAAVQEVGSDLDESIFHQWIFGAGNKIVSTRDHLDSLLSMAIADVERSCSLSDAQRSKLELAGRGDRKRFMDRVAEAKRVFDRFRTEPNGADEILQHTQPLSAAYSAGLYGDGSLFAKTLGSTLEPEQVRARDRALLEKARFRYKAKASLVLASLDARLGLTSEQSRRFLDLVLEESTPPRVPAGAFEESVVFFKIAQLPEEKVRPIFDDAQWKKLGKIFVKARDLEPFLRSKGYLD